MDRDRAYWTAKRIAFDEPAEPYGSQALIDRIAAALREEFANGIRKGCDVSRAECESVSVSSARSAREAVEECAERVRAIYREADAVARLHR